MARRSQGRKHSPRVAIRQWILDARLAGGVHGDCDISDALRSARLGAERLRDGRVHDTSRFFFDIGVQYLCAYMVTMANEPGDDVVVDVSREQLAELATRQPEACVRADLLQGASYADKVFSASWMTLGLYED